MKKTYTQTNSSLIRSAVPLFLIIIVIKWVIEAVWWRLAESRLALVFREHLGDKRHECRVELLLERGKMN